MIDKKFNLIYNIICYIYGVDEVRFYSEHREMRSRLKAASVSRIRSAASEPGMMNSAYVLR